MIGEPIGAALNRDIATGEKIEHKLDAFSRKRDKERRRTEGERPEEEAWKESVRRYEAARDAHLRQECSEVPHSPGRPSQGYSRSSRGTSRA